jgi:hypothetical protein
MTAALALPGPPGGIAIFLQQFVDQLADAIAARLARYINRESEPRIAPRWLDLESAAQLMSTTKDAVRGMARAKLFPVKKMGGRVMIDVKDLERAFDENTAWL